VCVLHCLLGTCHILQTTDIFQIGQRTDVIVKANGNSSGAYWVRSSISRACSTANQPDALAVIYYEKADNNSKPTSTPWPVDDSSCTNDALSKTIPFFPFGPPARPATTQTIDIGFGPNATSSWVWTMNNSTFRANYNNPLLLLARLGNTSYPNDPEWNVYNFESNSSMRIIVRNFAPVAHPMHLHGRKLFPLSRKASILTL
jgi:FtsP/CotA-like multicopper oxidase with cupredoxin domain